MHRDTKGGCIVLSSAMTGKSTAGSGWLRLNGVYRNFGIAVRDIGSTVTSGYTIKVRLAASTVGAAGSSWDVVQATSANRNKIKVSTGNIPASYVQWFSTKFTTKAGRKLRVELLFLP